MARGGRPDTPREGGRLAATSVRVRAGCGDWREAQAKAEGPTAGGRGVVAIAGPVVGGSAACGGNGSRPIRWYRS